MSEFLFSRVPPRRDEYRCGHRNGKLDVDAVKIVPQRLHSRFVKWHFSSAVLAVADHQQQPFRIEVFTIQGQSLSPSNTGDRKQSNECLIGGSTQWRV